MDTINDHQLIDRCLAGCQESWRQVYTRAESTIRYIVSWRQWNFNPHQIEEIGQEVLKSLITSLDKFDFNCSLETFASTITKNRCVSEMRRRSAVKRAGEHSAVSLPVYDAIASPEEIHEHRLIHEEDRRLLAAALRQLGENCRTILRLKYYEEYSYKQIGEALSLPAGTVASRLRRCLLQLRQTWEECTEGC